MMAAQSPPGGGDAPNSRNQVVDEEENMDVELALSAHALLSGEEEGEVHLDDGTRPEAGLQGFSVPMQL